MIIDRNYNGTAPGQCLVFADKGLPELMRWMETVPPLHQFGLERRSYGSDWDEGASWDDVVTMTKNGWSEGAQRIAKGFPKPAFTQESKRPHWGYDVAGAMPDVGRYLAGDPRCMHRRRIEHGRKPFVTLYIGMGVRASVSAKEFTNFGTAVCELIDTLENNGTRVELNQLTRASTGKQHLVTGWRVKEAGDALDLAAVAFTYMHPAAHRRLQFQLRARVSRDVGASTSVYFKDFPDAPEDAIIFAGISDNPGACKTMAGAREFLRQRINQGAGKELITTEMLEHLH